MNPLVGIIMGSTSDWETLRHSAETLEKLGVPHEVRVVSAHRTPDLLFDYAGSARARGLEVIIAGAGGAAHLPGMAAAKTSLPVLGVPVQSLVPFGPLAGAASNVTLLSYQNDLNIGINVDPAAVSDIDTYVECIRSGYDEVLDLA